MPLTLEQAVLVFQRRYRAKRNRDKQRVLGGLDWPVASAENHVIHLALLQDPDFIQRCIQPVLDVSSSSSQTSSDAASGSHMAPSAILYSTVTSSSSSAIPTQSTALGLTEQEHLLYDFFQRHLTLQTAVSRKRAADIGSTLLSMREMYRQDIDNEHAVVPRMLDRDDQVYFVSGISRHPNAPQLRGDDFVTYSINLSALAETDPHVLAKIWTSPHASDVFFSAYSDPVILSGTRFQFCFDNASQTITYHIRREQDKQKLVWRIHVNQLVFHGRQVMQGLAMHFILLLRLVGGRYQQHILDTITCTTSSINSIQKQKILSIAMTALMPGWLSCEVKIPNFFNINKSYVRRYDDAELKKLLIGTDTSNKENFICEDPKDPVQRQFCSFFATNLDFYHHEKSISIISGLLENNMAYINHITRITMINRSDSNVHHAINENIQNYERENIILMAIVREKTDNIIYLKVAKTIGIDFFSQFNLYLSEAIVCHNYTIASYLLTLITLRPEDDYNIVACLVESMVTLTKKDKARFPQALLLLSLLQAKGYSVNQTFANAVTDKEHFYQGLGYTPLDFAIMYHLDLVITCLLELGAQVEKTYWFQRWQGAPLCSRLTMRWSEDAAYPIAVEASAWLPQAVRTVLSNYIRPQSIGSGYVLQSRRLRSRLQAVAVIVTGLTRTHKPYVILGKNRRLAALQFPGGLVDAEDTLTAATRELKEETGVDLTDFVETYPHEVQVLTKIYVYELSSITKLTFVHINIGYLLQDQYVYPQDDLVEVEKVLVNDIVCLDEKTFFYKGKHIKYSNAYLLNALFFSGSVDYEYLEKLLFFEQMADKKAINNFAIEMNDSIKTKIIQSIFQDLEGLLVALTYDVSIISYAAASWDGVFNNKFFILSLLTCSDVGTIHLFKDKLNTEPMLNDDDKRKVLTIALQRNNKAVAAYLLNLFYGNDSLMLIHQREACHMSATDYQQQYASIQQLQLPMLSVAMLRRVATSMGFTPFISNPQLLNIRTLNHAYFPGDTDIYVKADAEAEKHIVPTMLISQRSSRSSSSSSPWASGAPGLLAAPLSSNISAQHSTLSRLSDLKP